MIATYQARRYQRRIDETLKEIASARDPIYAQSDLTVQARAEYSIDDMACAVIDTLLTRPDVLESSQ